MKFCVIGLGRFGRQVTRTLGENGAEVLAVDAKESNIASIKHHVAQAMCLELTDEASLEAIGIDEIDVVVIGIGENFAQAILIAAILKKRFKTCKVIARANNTVQEEILTLIGVDQVIRPEQETAIELADTLSSPFTNLARLNNEFSIGLIATPTDFIGKTIEEVNLYDNYKVNCFAIKRDDLFISVNQSYVILENDKLVVSGNNNKIEELFNL